MSKQSEFPLMLEVKPSDRLKLAVIFAHFLACGACIANSLAISIKLGLCTLICMHLWLAIKQLSRQRYQIRYSEQTGWEVAGRHGFEAVRILKSTLTTIFVIILHIKSQNNDKLAILVVSDALHEDDYRQLIVKLKTTVIEK